MNLWLLAFLVACFVGTRVPAVHAPGTVYAIPTHLPQISCLPTILLCPPFACPQLQKPSLSPSPPLNSLTDSSPAPSMQKLLASVQLLEAAGPPASFLEPPP